MRRAGRVVLGLGALVAALWFTFESLGGIMVYTARADICRGQLRRIEKDPSLFDDSAPAHCVEPHDSVGLEGVLVGFDGKGMCSVIGYPSSAGANSANIAAERILELSPLFWNQNAPATRPRRRSQPSSAPSPFPSCPGHEPRCPAGYLRGSCERSSGGILSARCS